MKETFVFLSAEEFPEIWLQWSILSVTTKWEAGR